jgi:hypothetical protein
MSTFGPKIYKAMDSSTTFFHIIENKPDVDVREKGTNKLDIKTFKGDFMFKKVNFNYPTRPELKIL